MKRIIFILCFGLCVLRLMSQTNQIDVLQKQREILQQEIQNTNKLFLDVKKQTTTLLQRIQLINKQISARKELIDVQKDAISTLDDEIQRIEKEVARLEVDLKKNQDSYAKAVKSMLKTNRTNNTLFFVLSGKSIGESLRRMQYLRNYSRWRKEQAEEIKAKNEALKIKKNELALAKAEKQKTLIDLQNEQKKLTDEEKARESEMAQAKGKQQELQKTLQQKRQQAAKLNARIEQLIAEEVARQEREAEARRRAEEAERQRLAELNRQQEAQKQKSVSPASKSKSKSTSKTQEPAREEKAKTPAEPTKDVYVASAETFNLSKNFSQNKGRLPMPVTGTASIVSNFGINKNSEWNVSINSNGIDIQAQPGAKIRSVFDGEVSKVFSFPGSNNCVIVRHGDYYTFYANIQRLDVRQGDNVKAGQSLGDIFTDPDTGIANMHFQLWHKTTKLDPAPWIRR